MLPLVRKDGQPELAREVYEELRELMQAEYDEGGAIGRAIAARTRSARLGR